MFKPKIITVKHPLVFSYFPASPEKRIWQNFEIRFLGCLHFSCHCLRGQPTHIPPFGLQKRASRSKSCRNSYF